jgi:cell division protein FtsL
VSAPAAAAAAGAPARRARTPVPTRPRISPPRSPRRISGPARTPAKRSSHPSQPRTQAERGLVPALLGALNGVSRSGALDRLIRGRIWIAVIAFALIGIVTLQLLVLQLNASIGRSLVREAQLQRANAALSIESSELSAGERVESQAGRLGMQLVPLDALRFLTADPRADVVRAAAALKTPVHATGSGEAGAATTQTASSETTAAGEQAQAGETGTPTSTQATSPIGETGTPTSTQATSPTGEAGTSTGEADAPSSEAPGSSVSSAAADPAAATGASATAPAEAPTAATVGGAGGVGASQPSGAG